MPVQVANWTIVQTRCIGNLACLGCLQMAPLKDPKTGRPRLAIVLILGVGLIVIAFGGVALANVTTGGGPGFDVLSAGSAVQPSPPTPTPAPTPAPAPAPAPDTTPPALTGIKGATAVSNKKGAKFTFGSSEAASFVCRVDNRAFRPCTSPFKAPKLGAGHHTFSVQAIDAAGNRSPVSKTGFQVEKPATHKKHHG
jgi:hypothetical protein